MVRAERPRLKCSTVPLSQLIAPEHAENGHNSLSLAAAYGHG
jgi:hypothetical protein